MNKNDCPCKRTQCPRLGDCKACIEHHNGFKRKMRPACERIKLKNEAKQKHLK